MSTSPYIRTFYRNSAKPTMQHTKHATVRQRNVFHEKKKDFDVFGQPAGFGKFCTNVLLNEILGFCELDINNISISISLFWGSMSWILIKRVGTLTMVYLNNFDNGFSNKYEKNLKKIIDIFFSIYRLMVI
jgi:hypothetical protein